MIGLYNFIGQFYKRENNKNILKTYELICIWLTLPHEFALMVVEDLIGDEHVVHHHVLAHLREAAMVLHLIHLFGVHGAPQKPAHLLYTSSQILRKAEDELKTHFLCLSMAI